MVKKERKKKRNSNPAPPPPRLLNFPDFSDPPDYQFSKCFPTPPPSPHRTIPHTPSNRDLRIDFSKNICFHQFITSENAADSPSDSLPLSNSLTELLLTVDNRLSRRLTSDVLSLLHFFKYLSYNTVQNSHQLN